MNKRTRLIVSVLFVVVILMAAAITRFYLNVPDNTAVNGGGEGIDRILDSDGSGYSIFSDSSGFCGIAESGRITAAPEWLSLRFAGSDRCIASKKTGGHVRFGCIDLEGNVVVPLIYSNIESRHIGELQIYCAVSEDDGSCVVYDKNFVPYFGKPWKSCRIGDDEIVLADERGSYVYTSTKEGLLFKRAASSGSISSRPYELNIYSRVLLSKLTPAMIEKMTAMTENYIEYAYGGDKELISDIGGDLRQFRGLFPDSPEITARRLKAVPEIHIYAVGTDNEVPLYEVSVTTEGEIDYTDEQGAASSYTAVHKAAVRFRGSSEMNLEAVSGAFEKEEPEYPIPEPEYPAAEYPTETPTEASTDEDAADIDFNI